MEYSDTYRIISEVIAEDLDIHNTSHKELWNGRVKYITKMCRDYADEVKFNKDAIEDIIKDYTEQ